MEENQMVKKYILTRKTFLLIILIVICILGKTSGVVADDHIRNFWKRNLSLDFEKPVPDGWTIMAEGFRVELDDKEYFRGRQSLGFTFENETTDIRESSFGLAYLKLPVKSLLNRRIRFSAQIKTSEASAFVNLLLRAVQGEDPVAVASLPGQSRPRGTENWKKCIVEMDIPPKATDIFICVLMRGKGKAWIDDVSLEILPVSRSQTIRISGQVRDKDGKPVKGALVTAKTFYAESTSIHSLTNPEGEFSFQLLPNFYTFSATAPGLTANSLPLQNFNKDRKDLVINLNKDGITIKGTLKIPLENGLDNTFVVAGKLDFFGGDLFYVKPRPDGSFQVKVPGGIFYKIGLDSPDYLAEQLVINPDLKKNCILKAFIPEPAPEKVVSWIKKNALPLSTVEAGKGFRDLQSLKKIIGPARVVALGETSHATREIFQMKHRLLEFLVEEMGFSVFALEALWPQAMAVNDYVLHGKGDPSRVLANLYFVWDTEEVLAVIKWMRKYNTDSSHQKKVKFFGVDILGSTVAAEWIEKYLEKVDPAFLGLEFVSKSLTILKNRRVYGLIYRFSEQECINLKENVSRMLLHFDRQQETYMAKSSSRNWLENRHLVRYLQQFVYHAVAGNTSDYTAIDFRDRAIAENIKWILDNETPGTRIVYWAHNYHITVGQYPTFSAIPSGRYLQQQLGKDYLSIGFEFNRGSFLSRDSTISRTPFLLTRFFVDSEVGSFGETLSRTGIPVFLLDLRIIPSKGQVTEWFSRSHRFKSIDSVFAGQKDIEHLFRLPDYFDAILFIDITTPTRPNPSSPVPRLFY
jgi:erythromycin esterase